MRRRLIGATVIVLALAGCGSSTPRTPSAQTVTINGLGPAPVSPQEAAAKAKLAVEDLKTVCDKPGYVAVREGRSSESCVERAHAYQEIARNLKCPHGARLRVDLKHHVAHCDKAWRSPTR